MARYKILSVKRRLARAYRSNKPVPIWVVAKTMGRVRTSPARRHWRRTKLKIKREPYFSRYR
jgi:large subunit ribosomal protein L39e